MVPVHYLSASRHLYIAFVDRVNYTALYSVEKVLDCHTEPCLAPQSDVQQALRELETRPHPTEILIDNLWGPEEMAEEALSQVLRLGGLEVRIGGFDGFIWARISSPGGFTHILFKPQPDRTEIGIPAEGQP